MSTARPVIASVRRAALDASRPLEHGQLTVSHHQPPAPPPFVLMYERTPWPPPQRHHSFVFTRTSSQPTTRTSLRSPAATNLGHPPIPASALWSRPPPSPPPPLHAHTCEQYYSTARGHCHTEGILSYTVRHPRVSLYTRFHEGESGCAPSRPAAVIAFARRFNKPS